jgi:hypothetical protein
MTDTLAVGSGLARLSVLSNKKCVLVPVTKELQRKLAGTSLGQYPVGTVLLGVEDGAEFTLQFGFMDGSCGAVIPSIRGINPITGLRAGAEPWSSTRGDYCPADASHGRLGYKGYCACCDHHWASSNFVSIPQGSSGYLHGWRVGEDKWRKFVATADMGKDVAVSVDAGSVVPALGFLFYKGDGRRKVYDTWKHWSSFITPSITRAMWPDKSLVGGWGSATTNGTPHVLYSSNTSNAKVGGEFQSMCLSTDEPQSRKFSSAIATPPVMAVGASSTVDTQVGNYFDGMPVSAEELLEDPCVDVDARLVDYQELVAALDRASQSGPLRALPTV